MKNTEKSCWAAKSLIFNLLFVVTTSIIQAETVVVEMNQPTSAFSPSDNQITIENFEGRIVKEENGDQNLKFDMLVRLEDESQTLFFNFEDIEANLTQFINNSYAISPWKFIFADMLGTQSASQTQWVLAGRIDNQGNTRLTIGFFPQFSSDLSGTYSITFDPTYLLYGNLAHAGDLNNDCLIDGSDASLMFSNWGSGIRGDINGDGIVDAADFVFLLTNWDESCH